MGFTYLSINTTYHFLCHGLPKPPLLHYYHLFSLSTSSLPFCPFSFPSQTTTTVTIYTITLTLSLYSFPSFLSYSPSLPLSLSLSLSLSFSLSLSPSLSLSFVSLTCQEESRSSRTYCTVQHDGVEFAERHRWPPRSPYSLRPESLQYR